MTIPLDNPPSLGRLARTTAIALLVAAVLLATIVLPAEYGVDPLGTGRRLGLTQIAAPPVTPMPRSEWPALKPVVRGPLAEYGAAFKTDVYEVTLQAYEYVEYKYHLEQGASFVYAWKATAPVSQDVHAEREGGASAEGPAEESFDKQDREESSGTFTAPFTGIHGWYWENPSATPITVRLTTAGFYGSAIEIHSDGTRQPRTLRTLDTLGAPR